MRRTLLALSLLVSAGGCKEASDKVVVRGRLKDAWGQISDSDHVRTRGVGLPPRDAVGRTERMARARQAALISARYEIILSSRIETL